MRIVDQPEPTGLEPVGELYLVDTQRLDLFHLMARQQLADAADLPLEQRLEYQQAVWTHVLANVGTLSAGHHRVSVPRCRD